MFCVIEEGGKPIPEVTCWQWSEWIQNLRYRSSLHSIFSGSAPHEAFRSSVLSAHYMLGKKTKKRQVNKPTAMKMYFKRQ